LIAPCCYEDIKIKVEIILHLSMKLLWVNTWRNTNVLMNLVMGYNDIYE